MSGDRHDYVDRLPPLRDVVGEALQRPSSLRPELSSYPSSLAPFYRYGGNPVDSRRSFTLPAPVSDNEISRFRPSTAARYPRFDDPDLRLPPLRLPSQPAPLPPRRSVTPAPDPPPSPVPPHVSKRDSSKALPTLSLAPPGHQKQPLAKPYAPRSPPPQPSRTKSPKPSLMHHYPLNPPVVEGAPDIYTYATPTGVSQPSMGPVKYTFTVMREQQGDLVDVRTPSSRAQGILRPTAILEDEDQSHKRYKCTFPGCDKRYDRPSSLEVHKHSHTDNPAPFRCSHRGCNRTFSVKSNMLRHGRSHQGRSKLQEPKKIDIPDSLDKAPLNSHFIPTTDEPSPSPPPLPNSPAPKKS